MVFLNSCRGIAYRLFHKHELPKAYYIANTRESAGSIAHARCTQAQRRACTNSTRTDACTYLHVLFCIRNGTYVRIGAPRTALCIPPEQVSLSGCIAICQEYLQHPRSLAIYIDRQPQLQQIETVPSKADAADGLLPHALGCVESRAGKTRRTAHKPNFPMARAVAPWHRACDALCVRDHARVLRLRVGCQCTEAHRRSSRCLRGRRLALVVAGSVGRSVGGVLLVPCGSGLRDLLRDRANAAQDLRSVGWSEPAKHCSSRRV